MFGSHCQLEGRLHAEVYDSNGNLKYKTEPVKNFITATGLSMIALFPIADCFRYITLGSGTAPNDAYSTTGLSQQLNQFSYIGSRSNHDDVNTTEYVKDKCTYLETENKVSFQRAWRVPVGDGNFLDGNYVFNEWMTSPGQPRSTGLDPGDLVTHRTICRSDQYLISGDLSTQIYGPEASDLARNAGTAENDPCLCDYYKAFARVVAPFTGSKGDYMTFLYNLDVVFDTGIKKFDIHITEQGTLGAHQLWTGHYTGYTQLVHHGIKLINDGHQNPGVGPNGPNGTRVNAGYNYNFDLEYGESFVPAWGSPVEPSCGVDKIEAYASTDNLQFLANQYDGGGLNDAGLNLTSVTSSGLMGWRKTPSSDISNNANQWPQDNSFDGGYKWVNIRKNGAYAVYPDPTDVHNDIAIQTATPNALDVYFYPANRISRNAMTFTGANDRNRNVGYSYEFWGANAQSYLESIEKGGYLPVRAMVLGYVDTNNPWNVPFVDMIVSSSGTSPVLPPPISSFTYSPSGSPARQYFYITGGFDLTFTLNVSWSSPCVNNGTTLINC